MGKRIYRVTLSTNFNQKINLADGLDKILEAANVFAEENNYRKTISLYNLEKNQIELLISLDSKNQNDNFLIRHITGFLKQVCIIYDLKYDSRRKFFTIAEAHVISEKEYPTLLSKGVININRLLKSEIGNKDFEQQMNNIKESENSDGLNHCSGAIKKPERKFPAFLKESSRHTAEQKMEPIEYPTLDDTMRQLDSMIGMPEIKRKIREIESFLVRNNERIEKLNIDNPGLYYNVAITGNKGTGKSKIAKLLYHIYHHLGVIGEAEFVVINGGDLFLGENMERHTKNARSGVVFIDNAHLILESNRRDGAAKLDEWMTKYKDNFTFIIAGEEQGIDELLKGRNIGKQINFLIKIPDLTETETLELAGHYAGKERFLIDSSAEKPILDYLAYLKKSNSFENAYTARRIVENAIINNGIFDDSNSLVEEDFCFEDMTDREREKAGQSGEEDPLAELEELIGLDEVKEKVKEISAYAVAQRRRKELGLKVESLCLHMNYVGNPGTGKTTIARCMGKILKNLNILTTGKFVEVSREDLVGKYVGHTAMKTAEKIKEAEGGILFIDEAYSLESESRIDFGHEAINTLVKKMEDLRDNLVVIFAGYPEEMSRFIKMNAGLENRIQFRLEFEDYKPQELLKMLEKFFDDGQYQIEEEALKEMEKIVNRIYKNRGDNFANGRIIRKCFERVKMQQAVRIMKDSLTEAEDIMAINVEDIKSLYEAKDISELQEPILKKCIGFIG